MAGSSLRCARWNGTEGANGSKAVLREGMGRLAHSLGSEEELDAGWGLQAVHGAKATAYGASCGSVTRATTRGEE